MGEKQVHIDGIDKIILKQLMNDARAPILGIAKEVGISGAAIHQRLRKLKKTGLLKGSNFVIDPKALGYKTLAFVGVSPVASNNYKEVIIKLKEIPEVVESHYTTGKFSIFIKVLCKNNEHLMQLLNNKIQAIKGVTQTETFISLDQQIDRQISV